MPIYEYQCTGCTHEFEAIQKFSDEPLTICPTCKENFLEKKVSMSAFQLKGGGWYKDGYGKKPSSSSSEGTKKKEKKKVAVEKSSAPSTTT